MLSNNNAERGKAEHSLSLAFFIELVEESSSPYINQFLSADTIVPGYANPQNLNRFAYVLNNPLRYTDPTGHLACDDEDENGQCVNYEQVQRRKLSQLRRDLKKFKKLPTYRKDEMIVIEFSDYATGITPDEYRLLQNSDGTLNDLMYYRMASVTLAARNTAENLFPDQPGDNSPRNAFQHAYWNALMTVEFGEDFAAEFGTAHEKGAGSERESQFMDLHNNEVGRNIGSDNPTAPAYVLAAQVLQALQDGELYVWDGGDIYFSDQCPLCSFP